MFSFYRKIADANRRRIAYNRTVEELTRCGAALERDFGILRSDIERVARQAVYGA